MDTLSRLLRMARLDAALDRHCPLSTSTRMDVGARGHREAAFHVVLAGECRLQIDGSRYLLQAGDVVVIPRGEGHRITTAGGGPSTSTRDTHGRSMILTESVDATTPPTVDLYCGHFRYGAGVGAVLFGSLPSPIVASLADQEGEASPLDLLSNLLRSEVIQQGRGAAAILSSLCTVLLALVLRDATPRASGRPIWFSPADGDIARVLESILSDPARDWSISAMSSAVHLSRATFLRRFTRATGTTPSRLVARVRMMAAAELLSAGDLTVAAVAAQVGYESESSFAKSFATEVGKSPGAFRRQQRESPAVIGD